MPLLRTGLAYPAGLKAGFDPSHIAVQGQVTGRIFSAVAHNRNMVSLLRGLPGAIGATAITFGMDGIAGPIAVFTDNSTTCTTGFSGHTTGTDAVCTMAYIGVFPSAPAATAVFNSSNASNRMAMGIVGGFYNVYVGTAFADVSSGIPVLTGAPFFLCCSLRTGASSFVLVNLATGKVTTATSAVAFTNSTTDGIFQIGANSQVNSTNVNLSAVMYSPKSLNMTQLLKWAADPWSFWYPRQAGSKRGSSINAYTLAAGVGTYSLAGAAASLLHKCVLPAATGAYTLTGTAATLRRNLPLVAGAGSYTMTGTAASLLHKYILTASAGAYTLTGQSATLRHGFAVAAVAGAYTLTGSVATLRKTWLLGAGAGAYTLTGSAVTLTYLSGKTVVASAGSYTLTGTAATLLHKYVLPAGVGTYALSGVAATLRHGYVVTVGAGNYTLTGSAATLRKTWLLSGGAGSYVLSGSVAALTYSSAPPAVTPPVGSSISGGTFSRGRWRALREAQQAAEDEARAADEGKRKRALDRATGAAAKALEALQEEEAEHQAVEVKATAMRHALEAATGAERIKTVIEQSNRVVELAKQIIRQIEDDEEQEEAIAILMLH